MGNFFRSRMWSPSSQGDASAHGMDRPEQKGIARKGFGMKLIPVLLAVCAWPAWADGSAILQFLAVPIRTGMVAAPQKSNGSGIEVRYQIQGTPAVGQESTVALTLAAVTDPTGASVRFSTAGDLRLLNGDAAISLRAGQPTQLRVSVVPSAEGMGYLNVFTTQHGITSTTAVPVRTGDRPLKMEPSGSLKETPSGDKLITMPVN